MKSMGFIPFKNIKIHFLVKKEVKFGEAVYAVGNIEALGSWKIERALRLIWNEENIWSGFVIIDKAQGENLEFKHAVANYDVPECGPVEWQTGLVNRRIKLCSEEENIVVQNCWNEDRIQIYLLVPIEQRAEYYLVGGCKELGNWKNKIKLEERPNIELDPHFQRIVRNYSGWEANLYLLYFRSLKNIEYYYFKKTDPSPEEQSWESERLPQRQYSMVTGVSVHPRCLHTCHRTGGHEILQISNFFKLNYSQISEHIFLGAYIQTLDDIKQLHGCSIDAIINVQNEEDIRKHSISLNMIKMLCRHYKIEYYWIPIEENNHDPQDFTHNFQKAVLLLDELTQGSNRVYLHCTAGKYRSPLILAIYFSLCKGFHFNEAIDFIKQKHPLAVPNEKLVKLAIEYITEKTTSSHVNNIQMPACSKSIDCNKLQ